MKKRTVSLLIALLMVGMMAVASAAPSVTVPDLVPDPVVSTYPNSDGTSAGGAFSVEVTAYSDAVNAVVQKIQSAKSPIAYFSGLRSAIAAKLPAGTDLDALQMHEVLTFKVGDYKSGGASITFGFTTEFKNGQAVVAMVGIPDADGNFTWNALTAKVVGGSVVVEFPANVLAKIGDKQIAIAILSVG